MILSSGFKGQLTAAEQKEIESKVPMHQARICMSFRCNLTINKKTQNDCFCALSEHMVTILPKPPIGKTEKVYHFFDITTVEMVNDHTVRFETESDEVFITTTVCLKFVRLLLRNYILSVPLLPPGKRFKFNPHDTSKFPPFEPQLSVSQMFQFQYNANCSYCGCSYIHEVATYYHELAKMNDGIFDINCLPPSLVGEELDDGIFMHALFSTLPHSMHVRGINCEGIFIEDALSELSLVVESSRVLNLVRMVDVGGVSAEGMQDLVAAVTGLQNMGVVYWDLSENELHDAKFLFQALGRSKARIATLRVENCKLQEADIGTLLMHMKKHRSMRYIRELAIAGNRLSTRLCNLFKKTFELLSNTVTLERLSIGPCQVSEAVTTGIDASRQPLKYLTIVDTNLTKNSIYDLNRLISLSQVLKSLGLDGCNINDVDFESLLMTIVKNEKIPTIALSLNRMKMKKEVWIPILLKAVKNGLGKKLVRLSMDRNGIGRTELSEILKAKAAFVSLTELSISQNFVDRPDTGKMLKELLEIKSLRGLHINGKGSSGLRSEAIPLLKAIAKSPTLMQIDISGNAIGDAAIIEATNLVKNSQVIRRVMFDSNGISNMELLRTFLDVCSESKSLVIIDVPRKDMLACLKSNASLQESLAYRYYRASRAVSRNLAKRGLDNSLFLTDDEILRRLIDEETVLIRKLNEDNDFKVYQHSAIAAAVGLPLPFEVGTTVASALKDLDGETPEDGPNVYVSPLLLVPTAERPDDGPRSMVYKAIQKRCADLIHKIAIVPIPRSERADAEEEELFEEESQHEDEGAEDFDKFDF